MALDVFWEEEDGGTIETCPVWYKSGDYVTDFLEFESTICLRFIDDYGNTTFNQVQIPVLIEELESLLPKAKDAEARLALETLIAFVRKAVGKVHTYIKFIGD
jgi:hypothetical protein